MFLEMMRRFHEFSLGKLSLLIGMLVMSLTALIMPPLARIHPSSVIALRIAQGKVVNYLNSNLLQ